MITTTFDVIPQSRDPRDFHLPIPVGLTPSLPQRVDLRIHTGAVENQLTTSSCVANATVSALELLMTKAGKFNDLSRLFNYYNIRRDYTNLRGVDGGAYLSDGFKSVANTGICLESTWGFDVANVNTTPPTAAYEEALRNKVMRYERVGNFNIRTPIDDAFSVEMIKTTLAMGYPVTIAMVVNATLFDLYGNIGTDSCRYKHSVSEAYPSVGGHAMLIVGYDEALGGFIVENSWGETWGDGGYGIIAYDVIKNDCFDAWTCTAFAGTEFAPEWDFLPSDPLQVTVSQGVAPSYKQGDMFYRSGILQASVTGGTPAYQYKWTSSDPSVVFVTQGEQTVASVMVATWAVGESRSIAVTCEVIDTSVPTQQIIKTSTIVRATKAVVDRGAAYRLYKAAFNRLPDVSGLAFWEEKLATGTTLADIAYGFIASAEFQTLYGSTISNIEFCRKLYQNVLGRAPDAGGLAFWVDALSSGNTNRVGVLIGFSESAENKLLA